MINLGNLQFVTHVKVANPGYFAHHLLMDTDKQAMFFIVMDENETLKLAMILVDTFDPHYMPLQ